MQAQIAEITGLPRASSGGDPAAQFFAAASQRMRRILLDKVLTACSPAPPRQARVELRCFGSRAWPNCELREA